MQRVLFLDFDGVLHPSGGSDANFSRLPLLATLLRESDLADVQVVVSSTWREVHSLQSLRSFFPADLQPRVIGHTPVLDEHDTQFHRSEEIEAWLAAHHEVQLWAALDDDLEGFSPRFRGRTVFTEGSEGVNGGVLLKLRAMLET